MSTVIRIDDDVYDVITAVRHDMEREQRRRVSTSEAIAECLRRAGVPYMDDDESTCPTCTAELDVSTGFARCPRGCELDDARTCLPGYRKHRYQWGDHCVRCGKPKLASTAATERARSRT